MDKQKGWELVPVNPLDPSKVGLRWMARRTAHGAGELVVQREQETLALRHMGRGWQNPRDPFGDELIYLSTQHGEPAWIVKKLDQADAFTREERLELVEVLVARLLEPVDAANLTDELKRRVRGGA